MKKIFFCSILLLAIFNNASAQVIALEKMKLSLTHDIIESDVPKFKELLSDYKYITVLEYNIEGDYLIIEKDKGLEYDSIKMMFDSKGIRIKTTEILAEKK